MPDSVVFPLYRKYPDGKTYFRIDSYAYFEEVKVMGGYYQLYHYQAEKLPDRNLIADMVELKDGFWATTSKEEFDHFKRYCREQLKELR